MIRAAKALTLLVGRIFIAGVFIYDGTVIIRGWEATAAYVERFGISAGLLPLVVILQIGGGVLVVLGLLTRPVALAFAGFCVLTALIFHNDVQSGSEAIQFGKDFAMAGGFLFLVASGPGDWSLDARLGRG